MASYNEAQRNATCATATSGDSIAADGGSIIFGRSITLEYDFQKWDTACRSV